MSINNYVKHFLGKYPDLFVPIYRMFGPDHNARECLFSPTKEIVIEGFPRSANTFAVVAFRQAQKRHVPMAHHLHVEAQVLAGARRGLPVIVLIRNPVDAVKSLLIRHPNTGVEAAFRRYIDFYGAVYKVRNQVVLAPFEIVTSDFGQIIDRVNSKYGTNYITFINSEENVRMVYEEIEQINNEFDGGRETHVARPSIMRDLKKNSLSMPKKSAIIGRAVMLFNSMKENF